MKKHNALLAAIIILMLPSPLSCMRVQADSVYVPETQAMPFTPYRTPFTSHCSSFIHSRITTRTVGTGLILAGGASLYFAKPKKTKIKTFLAYLASFTAIVSGTMLIFHPDRTLDLCLRKPIEIGNQVGRLLRVCIRRRVQQPDQMANIQQRLLEQMQSSPSGAYDPASFDPIRERAMKDFRERVVPGIEEAGVAAGAEGGSSGTTGLRVTAEKDLLERLAAVEAEHRESASGFEERRRAQLSNFLINQQRLNMLENHRARIATENVIIELLRILCKAFQ